MNQVSETAVSFKDFTVTAGGGVLLLDRVSFEIPSGDFVGILGPNGAGKTTLFLSILGFKHPATGELAVLGKSVGRYSLRQLRSRIGFVPQTVNIDPRMPISAGEVIMMGRYSRIGFLRAPGSEDMKIVRRVAGEVGVEPLLLRPFGHLSGGERQRVLIARALAQEPELLILDEPAAYLDDPARHDILALIEETFRTHHVTTLIIAHESHHLPDACRKVVLLKRGRVFFQGDRTVGLAPEVWNSLFDTESGDYGAVRQ